jgi:hypothetical protein
LKKQRDLPLSSSPAQIDSATQQFLPQGIIPKTRNPRPERFSAPRLMPGNASMGQ